jgi:hypothetical protein
MVSLGCRMAFGLFFLAVTTPAAQTTLDNGVDPWNLGKGDWIWQVPQSQSSIGVSTVQDLVAYEKNKGMQWINVKCGDGGSVWSQFNSSLVTACHNAGLKVFAWGYNYGNNVAGELNVALNALSLGADGFVIDAEYEYETNAFNNALAIKFCQAIKAAYPNRFLAYAPSPSWSLHQTFPYREFGMYCDAIMPQDYWGYRNITPQAMVTMMNTQYVAWRATLSGSGTNAIKPVAPVAQADVATVPGSDESDFVYALRTDPSPLSPTGYHSVSFWDCQEHTADQWAAIGATNILLMTNTAPGLPIQPFNRCVDPGGSATFSARAYGAPFPAYQWRFNGADIPGATGSSFTVASAQLTNGGGYSVVASNSLGAATSRVVKLTIVPPAPVLQLAFSDTFETNSAALWNLFQGSANGVSDFTTNWAFDYSTQTFSSYGMVGFNATTQAIPVAPSTPNGTRCGLKLTVNKNDATASASGVSLYPKGMNFGSNYVLRFDAWINYNGGPGNGVGSTEFLTAGINHTGTRANWHTTGTSSDGLWFAVDGDGQSGGSDYRAYQGTGGTPTQLAFGASGMDVSGAVSFDCVDYVYGKLFSYPNYEMPGVPGKHWVQVELSQFNGVITWRLNGAVLAQRTNTTAYTSGNVMVGYTDPYSSIANPPQDNFVIIDNVRVYTAVNPPQLIAQPQGRTVNQGATWTANATAGGTAPLAWQWQWNGNTLADATNSALTLTNIQTAQAGTYTVVVTNLAGTATSSNALLAVVPLRIDSVPAAPGSPVQLLVTGAPGPGYRIEVSDDLTHWTVLTTFTNLTGVAEFTDATPTNLPRRFYRAAAPR